METELKFIDDEIGEHFTFFIHIFLSSSLRYWIWKINLEIFFAKWCTVLELYIPSSSIATNPWTTTSALLSNKSIAGKQLTSFLRVYFCIFFVLEEKIFNICTFQIYLVDWRYFFDFFGLMFRRSFISFRILHFFLGEILRLSQTHPLINWVDSMKTKAPSFTRIKWTQTQQITTSFKEMHRVITEFVNLKCNSCLLYRLKKMVVQGSIEVRFIE